MPTTRRRHTITETPQVQASLAAVREEFGDQAPSLSDLVVAGAEAVLARQREAEAHAQRSRRALAEMIRGKSMPGDPAAGLEVHETGWTQPNP